MRRDGHIVASNWHVNMAPTIVRDHTAIRPDKAEVLYFTLVKSEFDESLLKTPLPVVILACGTHLLKLAFTYEALPTKWS